MKRKGFTLIELLVVIAIIAILAAILFPVFAKAREKARQSSCLSNLKQIILAELMYTQDYGEKLPPYYRLKNAKARSVFEELNPYIKNGDVFHCPSDLKEPGPRASLKLYDNLEVKPSYGFRAESSGVPLGCIVEAKSYPVVLDLGGPLELWSRQHSPKPQGFIQPIFDKNANVIGLPIQHNKGINIGFADGHCKWWKTSGLYSDFDKKNELGGAQIPPRQQDPVRRKSQPAIVEDDVAIITLSAPLPLYKRFIMVHDGVVQYSGENK